MQKTRRTRRRVQRAWTWDSFTGWRWRARHARPTGRSAAFTMANPCAASPPSPGPTRRALVSLPDPVGRLRRAGGGPPRSWPAWGWSTPIIKKGFGGAGSCSWPEAIAARSPSSTPWSGSPSGGSRPRIGEGLILDLRRSVFGQHPGGLPVAFFTPHPDRRPRQAGLNNDVIGAQRAFTWTLSGVVSNGHHAAPHARP